MYNLFKPFGKISWEQPLVGDIVNLMGITTQPGPEREKEIEEKLKVCDILQADVDIAVNEALFEKAPNLKAVFCTSIGLDYVDIPAATKRGILVANNPDFCMIAVAEYVIGLMYAVMRRIPEGVEAVKADDWQARGHLGGAELYGRTLSIIGFGKIGREIARQAIGIGMKVHAYDPFMNEELAHKLGAVPMSLDDAIKTADVLTVQVPLIESTRNMISDEQFEMMKDGVYIVNCARGGIINEEAMAKYLENGKVAGAAFDVLTSEPPKKDNPLLNVKGKNLIITPHIAWYTAEAALKNHDFYAAQVRAFVNGEVPASVANREVLK